MNKRLFFGFPISFKDAYRLPSHIEKKLRVISDESRHATALFLGNVDSDDLLGYLEQGKLRLPEHGISGVINKTIFLPPRAPRVLALTGTLNNMNNAIQIVSSLEEQVERLGYTIPEKGRKWLFHVTVARVGHGNTIHSKEVKLLEGIKFTIPFSCHELNLYESLPGLDYRPIYTYRFRSN